MSHLYLFPCEQVSLRSEILAASTLLSDQAGSADANDE